jgi:hypothetical protein
MPPPLFLLLLLLLLPLLLAPPPSSAGAASFSLDFFPAAGAAAAAQLALSGGANATAAAVEMRSPGARVQYRTPIAFSSAAGLTFSTYFAFALPAASASASSLAFFLTPSSSSAAAASREHPALAVTFSARRVRVDLAGGRHRQANYSAAGATVSGARHAWVDYNATSATLHVRLSSSSAATATHTHNHPTPPLLSCPLDLSPVLLRGPVLAGFRTRSGNCTLFSWAFHAAPFRMHSQPLNPATLLLTTPPPHRAGSSYHYSPWGTAVSLLFAAACGAMLTFLVLYLWHAVTARRPVAPVVEYPMHPSDVAYQKIVLVGVKDDAATTDDDAHRPPALPNK